MEILTEDSGSSFMALSLREHFNGKIIFCSIGVFNVIFSYLRDNNFISTFRIKGPQ